MWKIDIYNGLFSDECMQSLGEFETKKLAFMALKEFAQMHGFDMLYCRISNDPKNKQIQWIDYGSWSYFARIEEINRKEKNQMEKQKYIVRCDRAGVFYGEIEGRDGKEIKMRNARCLWYWEGAATLLQLAAEGTTEPENCKFTMIVDSLVVLDAIEIIPCTDRAIKSIEAVKEWKR